MKTDCAMINSVLRSAMLPLFTDTSNKLHGSSIRLKVHRDRSRIRLTLTINDPRGLSLFSRKIVPANRVALTSLDAPMLFHLYRWLSNVFHIRAIFRLPRAVAFIYIGKTTGLEQKSRRNDRKMIA